MYQNNATEISLLFTEFIKIFRNSWLRVRCTISSIAIQFKRSWCKWKLWFDWM